MEPDDITQHHIDALIEALDDLLDVPELAILEPRPFDATLEAIANARSVRAAVLDEHAAIKASGGGA